MDAPYQRQLFVCTYGPWCRIDGGEDVRAALKDGVKQMGLASELRVTKSGCLGQCGNGPMAVMWPENVWYHRLKASDVPTLLEEHVRQGRPVESLRFRPAKPGSNKTPEVKAKEAQKGPQAE